MSYKRDEMHQLLQERPVVVMGAGRWAVTFSILLSRNEYDVTVVTNNQDLCDEINHSHTAKKYVGEQKLNSNIKASMAQQDVKNAKVILMVVPPEYCRVVLKLTGDLLSPNQIILHATKGLEAESNLTMSQIIKEESCIKKIGVLMGPNITNEILEKRPTMVTLASAFPEVREVGELLLQQNYFEIKKSDDLIGTELSGALSDVYALYSGVLDELGYAYNTRAIFMTMALEEMTNIGVVLGGQAATYSGNAGLGSLLTNCFSPDNPNVILGRDIARSGKLDPHLAHQSAGINTLKFMLKIADSKRVKLSLVKALNELIFGEISSAEFIRSSFSDH